MVYLARECVYFRYSSVQILLEVPVALASSSFLASDVTHLAAVLCLLSEMLLHKFTSTICVQSSLRHNCCAHVYRGRFIAFCVTPGGLIQFCAVVIPCTEVVRQDAAPRSSSEHLAQYPLARPVSGEEAAPRN